MSSNVSSTGLRGAGFPFSAVVGMDELRLALVLNAVSPAIGGVLVRGEKGTAKSTMVRALAAVLPDVDVVAGCRFSCDPADPDPDCPDGPHEAGSPGAPGARTRPARLVELPVGASEDRLLGALDIERALTEGVKAYEPGLLAAAHRGVLYVDEVNLLHDHLVDLLLDAAALGISYVERDGVSVRHAARFLLVGTMNPEEGELRPQLLDRFGLTVEAAAPRDPGPRAEVVRRRLDYDADPDGFRARWQVAETALAGRIEAARRALPRVVLPDAALRQVASVCASFGVDGLRADLVIARAALAHAAWQGRLEVDAEDIRAAARLALPHRRRRQPFDAPQLDEQQLDEALAAGASDDDDPGPGDGGAGGGDGPGGPGGSAPPEDSRPHQLRRPPPRRPHPEPHPHRPLQPQTTPESRQSRKPGSPHGPQRSGRAGRRGPGRGGRSRPRRARRGAGSHVPGPAARSARGRRGRGGPAFPGPGIRRAGHRGAAPPRAGPPGPPDRHPHGGRALPGPAGPDRAGRVAVAARGPARGPPGRPRGQPHPVPGGRQRLDGGPGPDGSGQGRGAVPAAGRLPAPGQGGPDHVPRVGRAGAAAPDLLGGGRRGPAGRTADRRPHPARRRVAPRARGAADRAAPRPRPPAPARRGHRRPRHVQRSHSQRIPHRLGPPGRPPASLPRASAAPAPSATTRIR